MMAVNKEIETMIFEYDLKKAEAKNRLNNIRRIKRDKCVSKILNRISARYPFFYKFEVDIKSLLFKKQIKKEYYNDILKEYNTIKQYLPEKAKSILVYHPFNFFI